MRNPLLLPPGRKVCPVCQGHGYIYQDVPGQADDGRLVMVGTIDHDCAECETRGSVPTSRIYFSEQQGRPDSIVTAYLARQPLFTTPNYRYCDLCGEVAGHSDIREDGRTIHRDRVCSLWDTHTTAAVAKVGDVVSSYRLLNYAAPMVVRNVNPEYGEKIQISLQSCLWVHSAGGLTLAADGAMCVREFPPADLMPSARPEIWRVRAALDGIPKEWLTARQSFF